MIIFSSKVRSYIYKFKRFLVRLRAFLRKHPYVCVVFFILLSYTYLKYSGLFRIYWIKNVVIPRELPLWDLFLLATIWQFCQRNRARVKRLFEWLYPSGHKTSRYQWFVHGKLENTLFFKFLIYIHNNIPFLNDISYYSPHICWCIQPWSDITSFQFLAAFLMFAGSLWLFVMYLYTIPETLRPLLSKPKFSEIIKVCIYIFFHIVFLFLIYYFFYYLIFHL